MAPAAESRRVRSRHARPTGELPGSASRNPLARHCPRLIPPNLVSAWVGRSRPGLGRYKVGSQSCGCTANPNPLRCRAVGKYRPLDMRSGGTPAGPHRRPLAQHADPATDGPPETLAKECCAAQRAQDSRNDGYLVTGAVALTGPCPSPGNAKGPDWCTIMSLQVGDSPPASICIGVMWTPSHHTLQWDQPSIMSTNGALLN